ncbi:acyl carrier protein [Kitasatospora sp. MAA4]|uniref:phosphopantetheine-binding protein n=1 Tax=Kitasatospora sp. MAA4 TaxID=3035093 RepID=UPI002474D86B|nr:phosphopantetheine-binding protein [Kitasatospora sp. MAA4]MDH6131466.1 acyl carrier protein [Kitasatospora sp. MAA4]
MNPDGNSADDGTVRHSQLEQAITRIWEDVLRLDGLTTEDDFFELGGHSLTASQVISRMRRSLEVEVPLAVFFQFPTIGGLAAYAQRQGGVR